MVKCTVRNAATAMSGLRFLDGAQVGYVLLAGGRQVLDNSAAYLLQLCSAGTEIARLGGLRGEPNQQ